MQVRNRSFASLSHLSGGGYIAGVLVATSWSLVVGSAYAAPVAARSTQVATFAPTSVPSKIATIVPTKALAATSTQVATFAPTAIPSKTATAVPTKPIVASTTSVATFSPTAIPLITANPVRTTAPVETVAEVVTNPLECAELSNEALESPESPYCVDSGDSLTSLISDSGLIQDISFDLDSPAPKGPSAGSGVQLPNGQFIPGSQNDFNDIINSACRLDTEAPGSIPDRLKGYGNYYNVRSWCCQHSAYLAVKAGMMNKIRMEMLRCRWKGGLHLIEGGECTWKNPDGSTFIPPGYDPAKGKPPTVVCVKNYGNVDGYLKACPGQERKPKDQRDLCVYYTIIQNGKVIEVRHPDYQWVVRRARVGCPTDSIGSRYPTSPGDVGRPPRGGGYSCKIVTVTVKLPDGTEKQIKAPQCEWMQD